eukprot:1160297-Pelagomonas_calceolata.AAC.2
MQAQVTQRTRVSRVYASTFRAGEGAFSSRDREAGTHRSGWSKSDLCPSCPTHSCSVGGKTVWKTDSYDRPLPQLPQAQLSVKNRLQKKDGGSDRPLPQLSHSRLPCERQTLYKTDMARDRQ